MSNNVNRNKTAELRIAPLLTDFYVHIHFEWNVFPIEICLIKMNYSLMSGRKDLRKKNRIKYK